MKNLLEIKEAAILLRLKKSTLYKYTCSKQIPHIKLGGKVLFDPAKLEAWIEDHSVKPIKASTNLQGGKHE